MKKMTSHLNNIPKIIAHRGGAGIGIENTLPTIEKSANYGVKWIEVDLRLSKDGKIFIFHDDDFTQFGYPDLSIETMTIKEISDFILEIPNFPNDHGHIPCLHHLFSTAMELNLSLNLEFKSTAENAENLILTLKNELTKWNNPLPYFYLSTFDEKTLSFCHKHLSAHPRSYLCETPPEDLSEKIRQYAPWSLTCDHHKNSLNTLKNYIQSGIAVLVYTVNNPAEAENLFSIGVTSIFTDYPNKMKNWL
jgi:glycerophosphoryl diester phosphodiesterase